MKILYPLGAFYPSQIGGPCNTLYWHTCSLKSNDIQPSILTTNIGVKAGAVELNKWNQLPCGNVYYGKIGFGYFKSFLILLFELPKNDIIHLNSLFDLFSIFSFFYGLFFFRKKKIIWSVRGELNPNALQFSNWKKKPILFLYKRFNKNVTFHSTSSEETIGIKNIFPKNEIIEIPNLLEPAERMNIPVLKNLVFIGRIHPIKALHKLIEALALSKVFLESDFKLSIVGKNEKRHEYYKEELISLVKKLKLEEKVHFKGHVEGKEKEKIYASSYALLLPSDTENFGNVVVESLNQGTPVIASKGTPWRILEEFNAGYHTLNDPIILSKKIDDILSLDKVSYMQMRANSVKLVDSNFNINTQIHKWFTTYKNVLNENQK